MLIFFGLVGGAKKDTTAGLLINYSFVWDYESLCNHPLGCSSLSFDFIISFLFWTTTENKESQSPRRTMSHRHLAGKQDTPAED